MSCIKYFVRDGKGVTLNVDSALDVAANVYPFRWNCGDENYAELLMNKLNEQLRKYKNEIARDPCLFLKPHQITALKRKLKGWNGNTGYWK